MGESVNESGSCEIRTPLCLGCLLGDLSRGCENFVSAEWRVGAWVASLRGWMGGWDT